MSPFADEQFRWLWFEPWRECAPGWLAPGVAPGEWGSLQERVTAAGMRLAWTRWCWHFGVAALPPSPPHAELGTLPPPAAWRPEAMACAALYIGQVAVASQPVFQHVWCRQASQLRWKPRDVARWRAALVFARARPLATGADACAGRSMDLRDDALVSLGWVMLRAALDQLWPHSWSWVRFRCDPVVLQAAAGLRAPRPPFDIGLPDALQVFRAWRTSVHIATQEAPA